MKKAHYLNTGQRLCHDAGGSVIDCPDSGQDGEFQSGVLWGEDRFRTFGEVVEDSATGLVWTRDTMLSGFPLSWSETLDFVESLNRDSFAGHADWRLPDRREMRSLISYATRVPAFPENHPFLNLRTVWYWTSTTFAGDSRYAWYVHTEGGRMFYGRKDAPYLSLPVRGESSVLPVTGQILSHDRNKRDDYGDHGVTWPKPRFAVRGEGVLDNLTGLIWSRNADCGSGPVSWEDAFVCAKQMRVKGLGGVDNWRLPTINELESLVDASSFGPAFPDGHPFENVGDVYWSSTNSAFEPDWAMCFYAQKGAVGVGFKKGEGQGVWCVSG